MAYCDDGDVTLLLGDLELPSSLDVTLFTDQAAMNIDLMLGQRYVVPFPTGDYFTDNLLKTANAELAASAILMALAQGGEDNRVNAYAMHLYNRANERLAPYFQDMILPGATLRNADVVTALPPVMIYQEDSVSGVEQFYRYVQNPSYVVWEPRG